MVRIAVVIPVYKPIEKLNEFERRSINNCLQKIADLDIFMAGPRSIKDSYQSEFKSVEFKVFKDHYFKNIAGYNRLLKHPFFYLKFDKYSHILIVQTDAWIFGNSENVKSFASWDFAGAPSFQNGKLRGYNGGLSLRNVQKCLHVLRTFRYFASQREIVKRHSENQSVIKILTKKWVSILLDLTIRNNFMYPLNRFIHDNEDIFWSSFVASKYPDFKVIEYNEAVKFAWEHNVAELYQSHPLPFGIHGWWNYNLTFWSSVKNEALLKELGLQSFDDNENEVHQNVQ